MNNRLLRTTLVSLAVLLTIATPAAGQTETSDNGVLVRIQGDVAIPADDDLATVVVVDGDLELAGSAGTIVVINGTAGLTEATADTVVVVNGTVDLGPGATVTGDVQLVNSELNQDPTATVDGEIRTDTDQLFTGFRLVGLLFIVGWAVLIILAALTLAAVAPGLARRSGRTITAEPGKTLVAALILWVAAPILSVVLFATIVGVPTALVLWFAVLPALGFVGLLVSGIRIGEYFTARSGESGHPYLAAVIGAVLLLVAGVVPVVGLIVVTFAAFGGSGALVLHAWRALWSNPDPTASSPTPSVADTGH